MPSNLDIIEYRILSVELRTNLYYYYRRTQIDVLLGDHQRLQECDSDNIFEPLSIRTCPKIMNWYRMDDQFDQSNRTGLFDHIQMVPREVCEPIPKVRLPHHK